MKQPNLFNPVHLLACGFGAGLSRRSPGTCGTALAVLIWYPLSYLPIKYYVYFLILAFLFGIFICAKTASDVNTHDPAFIVWDEFCGYWLTMLYIPTDWLWIICGFLLFRFFDILKPWPISFVDQQIKGGIGIMLDDIIAGIFANLLLHLIILF